MSILYLGVLADFEAVGLAGLLAVAWAKIAERYPPNKRTTRNTYVSCLAFQVNHRGKDSDKVRAMLVGTQDK